MKRPPKGTADDTEPDATEPDVRHAFILAGGKGVRLRPYTTSIPKPLVPIGEEHAILEIVLRQLAYRGFTKVTIAIGHLGHIIRAYVGDGSQWGLEVDYMVEDSPLGTIGPVVMSLDQLPEHFLVLNGDVLTDIDYGDVLRTHIASGVPATIATYEREVKIDFGVLEVSDQAITRFSEKPIVGYTVAMGVNAMSASTLRRYRVGLPFGFDELMLDLLARGEPPATYPFGGYWLDIGRPDDYDRANEEFAAIRGHLLPPDP